MPGVQRARTPAPTWRRCRPPPGRDGDGWRVVGPEDLDVVRDHGAVVLPAGPHVEGREEAAGPQRLPRADDATRGSRCGRSPRMLGPHHLNEVFFDDVWVTEADVLGPSTTAGASCRRCCRSSASASPATPAASDCCSGRRWRSATRGTRCPRSCAAGGRACSTHCRRARLLAYRVVALQGTGTVQPRRLRGLPDRGDPARPGERRGARRHRRRSAPLDGRRGPAVPPGGGGPLALLGVGDVAVGEHRDAAHPAGPIACWRRR